ncbi:MAG: penicillin-insensitive murein endopeptidase [Polyangiaceae bacterium]|nr:penicillin-insensitive murein endopeptidase [Polyangiaceae bacterium]
MRGLTSALVVMAASVALAPSARAGSERELPKEYRRAPYSLMSLTVGHPNDGWQVRAKRLKRTRSLVIKPSSAAHCYGHPALVLMLRRSAAELARAARGSVMVVGDLSRAEGGPLSGHHSHQSGRDADVAFYVKDASGKPVVLDHFVKFDARGRAADGSGLVFDDWRNWLLVLSWLRDGRAGLSHVFVASWLKHRLIAFAESRKDFAGYVPAALRLLHQPPNAEAHDDHFHVRISCPKRQLGLCKEESRAAD